MSESTSNSTPLAPLQRELYDFIVTELVSGQGAGSITPDEDLIKRGIVDSLGVQQLVDFCQSRYGIRVADADLVPANFQSLGQLANYVERKQAEASSSGRLRLRARGQ
jgi:acyl carrier protein